MLAPARRPGAGHVLPTYGARTLALRHTYTAAGGPIGGEQQRDVACEPTLAQDRLSDVERQRARLVLGSGLRAAGAAPAHAAGALHSSSARSAHGAAEPRALARGRHETIRLL